MDLTSMDACCWTSVICRTCSFMYVRESRRNWKSRGAEHKPGAKENVNSGIKQHVDTDHDIHPSYTNILEQV